MATETLQGNNDDGHTPREVALAIGELNLLANAAHPVGSAALHDVGGVPTWETDAAARKKAMMPAGRLAVSPRRLPPFSPPPISIERSN